MKRTLLGLALGLTLMASACAPIPPPQVLAEADRISQSPAAREMKEFAAPAWARAEKKRLEAHEALKTGPQARAQFLAEEAIALYHEGVVLSRLAKATLREKAAATEQGDLDRSLAEMDVQQSRATADVATLETRLRAARSAALPSAEGPEREAARRDAARSFLVQARLLCSGARLLGAGSTTTGATASAPDDPTSPAAVARDLAAAEGRITAVEAELADAKKPAALEEAARTRADCSSVLARTRRSGTAKGAAGAADALLEEISAMAAKSGGPSGPSRDERGVVVVLRNVFADDGLTATAKDHIATLDRVASTHKRFPVAVVVHTDKAIAPAEQARWQARAQAVASAFGSVDAARKVALVAADAEPLVPRSSSERATNARVEIVFIAPEAL